MINSSLGFIHTLAAVASLLIGAFIFLRPKSGIHKSLGYAYTSTMVIMIATAFFIYRLTGGFNFLHILAVVSTLTLGRALYHAITRKPKGKWLEIHYQWMAWSYLGLFAAFIAETSTRAAMPYLAQRFGRTAMLGFWGVVILSMFGSIYLGFWLLDRNKARLKRYQDQS